MSRSTSNAAARLSAVHATHTDGRDETGVFAPRPPGPNAPHLRVTPPPTVVVPPHVGGGVGWEINTERRALEAVADALTKQANGARLRVLFRDGLIGPWPWLHIGRPAGEAGPPAVLGVVCMVGTLWAYLGPPASRADSGPFDLGKLPAPGPVDEAGERAPADYSDHARAILTGLFTGQWPGHAAARPVHDPEPGGGVAALIMLSGKTGRPGHGPGPARITPPQPPG